MLTTYFKGPDSNTWICELKSQDVITCSKCQDERYRHWEGGGGDKELGGRLPSCRSCGGQRHPWPACSSLTLLGHKLLRHSHLFFSSCSFQGCNFLERKCHLDPRAIRPDASKGLPRMLWGLESVLFNNLINVLNKTFQKICFWSQVWKKYEELAKHVIKQFYTWYFHSAIISAYAFF